MKYLKVKTPVWWKFRDRIQYEHIYNYLSLCNKFSSFLCHRKAIITRRALRECKPSITAM